MASADRRGPVRCAIYTRKSTEEGLEQAFNSLDAQYEACVAYIVSQRHEGWTLHKARYDDGGFSGGSMERPGLKRLLKDVESGIVDVIVVYKVDRLTRSLADFARIVDVLDKRGASFVSVTQAFNTTTSMGRLTLNVLLSFAQFEREVTGERIRDKIAASKRKGMWMGGVVPLGYKVVERKLVIEPDEAQTVQHIFERYVALGSGQALIEELRADGYRTRERQVGDRTLGGVPFSRGMLFNLLSNPIYVGRIANKGETFEGEHEATIAAELWEQVQGRIKANSVGRKLDHNIEHWSLLAGVITDGLGRRMSPTHTNKQGRRYRYYVTHSADLRSGEPPAWRIPARDIEAAVQQRIIALLQDKRAIRAMLPDDADATATGAAISRAAELAGLIQSLSASRAVLQSLIGTVQLCEDKIRIAVLLAPLLRRIDISDESNKAELWLETSALKVRQGKATKLVISDDAGRAIEPDAALIGLLREAQSVRATILANPNLSISAIAAQRQQCRQRLLKLSWLAPDIVNAITSGRHPNHLTPKRLLATDFEMSWIDQIRRLQIT